MDQNETMLEETHRKLQTAFALLEIDLPITVNEAQGTLSFEGTTIFTETSGIQRVYAETTLVGSYIDINATIIEAVVSAITRQTRRVLSEILNG